MSGSRRPDPSSLTGAMSPGGEPSASSSAGALILVVDDDPQLRSTLIRILSRRGHVEAVDTAARALEALTKHEWPIVLLDLNLPDANGLDVLPQIKERSPKTEVIILTGYGSIESAVEGMKAAAFDYLEKPIQDPGLPVVIDRALAHRQMLDYLDLYRASEAIFATCDPEGLPAAIVDTSMRVMAADDGSLMLISEHGALRLAHSATLRQMDTSTTQLQSRERIAGRVLAEGKPAVIQGSLTDNSRFSDVESFQRVQSSIVYPLSMGDRSIGVLNINRIRSDNPFTHADLRRAGILAAQVALAVDNAAHISQLRSKIQQLTETQSRLVELERFAAMGEVTAGVFHEINNALTYVLGNVQELVREVHGSGEHHTWLKLLEEAAEGAELIRDIATDMMSLARRPRDSDRKRVDLNEVLATSLRIVRAKGADIHFDSHWDQNVDVVGHRGQLIQLFLNLIINAIHALHQCQRDDVAAMLSLRTHRCGDRVIAEITDNGPGIPEDQLTSIFQPFFTTKSRGEGTGLGLSICREIAERHDGALRVTSTVDRETTFELDLPAAMSEEHQQSSRPGPVLVVDDDAAVLRALQRGCGQDYYVIAADGGDRALTILRQLKVKLIICDVVMPQLSGLDLYERAISVDPDLEQRFIFMTGCMDQPEVARFVDRARPPVLFKPIAPEKLRSVLAEYLHESGGSPNRTDDRG